jgi:hypothetical protein
MDVCRKLTTIAVVGVDIYSIESGVQLANLGIMFYSSDDGNLLWLSDGVKRDDHSGLCQDRAAVTYMVITILLCRI